MLFFLCRVWGVLSWLGVRVWVWVMCGRVVGVLGCRPFPEVKARFVVPVLKPRDHQDASPSMDQQTKANLTRKALYHRLHLRMCIIRSPTPTKPPLKILPVRVLRVHLFRSLMQPTRVGQRAGRAIASETAFRKQLDLFVIRVTRDGTRITDPSGCSAG